MNNWSAQLDRRAAGEVPGFLGNNETIGDFVDRTRAEPEETLEPAPQPDAALSAAAAATMETPQRESAAPRSTTRTTSRTSSKARAKKAR